MQKNCRKCHLRWLRVTFLENGFCEDNKILQTYQGRLGSEICRTRRHQLLPVGCKIQLNTAQKCVKRVQSTKESINLTIVLRRITYFYMDIHADIVYSHTEYDLTSYLRSAFIEVPKNGRKCRIQRLWVEFQWRGVLPGSTNWWASCCQSAQPTFFIRSG